MVRVIILGKGAWGLALAQLIQGGGHQVQLWSRGEALRVEDCEIILSALPMQGVRTVAHQLAQLPMHPMTLLVSTTKGLEQDTFLTPREIWQQILPAQPLAVLSGPNLAAEIQQGLPCATVVASHQPQWVAQVQRILNSEYFRVYGSRDVRGVELGGALKNVIAISAGISDGLGLGINARAALVTRGLAEITRLGQLLGGDPRTFYGLSGLGDLQTTCTSPLSRNYQVGWRLAQGEPLTHILSQVTGTAEGVNTARVLVQLATQKQIELPIAQQVNALLNGQTTPLAAVTALMSRGLRAEWD